MSDQTKETLLRFMYWLRFIDQKEVEIKEQIKRLEENRKQGSLLSRRKKGAPTASKSVAEAPKAPQEMKASPQPEQADPQPAVSQVEEVSSLEPSPAQNETEMQEPQTEETASKKEELQAALASFPDDEQKESEEKGEQEPIPQWLQEENEKEKPQEDGLPKWLQDDEVEEPSSQPAEQEPEEETTGDKVSKGDKDETEKEDDTASVPDWMLEERSSEFDKMLDSLSSFPSNKNLN